MSVRSEEAVSPSANTTISSVYPNEFMESTRNIMDGKHWRLSAVFAPMTFEQERGSGGAAQPRPSGAGGTGEAARRDHHHTERG